MTKSRLVVEVCANGIQSAMNAELAGADRIELCENLEVDGLTPAYATIEHACSGLQIPVHVLIRPRSSDFVYSEKEFEQMRNDIAICKGYGVAGVVFGILKKDGSVDEERCAALIQEARPFFCTFHRAFDVVKNPFDALEQLIKLGFDRVLTSGQKPTCLEGSEMISELVKKSRGRISIMAGGGITEENIAQVVKGTHTDEFHFSAKVKLPDGSFVSDVNRVRKIKEIAENAFVNRKT